MYKFRNSVIAFFGLLTIAAFCSMFPHNGLGQEGPTKGICGLRPCDAVSRGRAAFNDRNLTGLGGNGRSCADCHMPSEGFQLSPAAAKARFEALQEKRQKDRNADDPLFRPIDADDFRVNGENATDFSN